MFLFSRSHLPLPLCDRDHDRGFDHGRNLDLDHDPPSGFVFDPDVGIVSEHDSDRARDRDHARDPCVDHISLNFRLLDLTFRLRQKTQSSES